MNLQQMLLIGMMGSGLFASSAAGDGKQPAGPDGEYRIATFAGGCFWCMEPPFDNLNGVIETIPGYTGGPEENPTYEDVSSGGTGHAEAIRVVFDPRKVSYERLLDVFWRNINPVQADGQFADVGRQYRTAVFYHDEEQKRLAVESRDRLAASGRFKGSIKTEIAPAGPFYPAEEYHWDYYLRNPSRYKLYRFHSGREQYLEKTWGTSGKP